MMLGCVNLSTFQINVIIYVSLVCFLVTFTYVCNICLFDIFTVIQPVSRRGFLWTNISSKAC